MFLKLQKLLKEKKPVIKLTSQLFCISPRQAQDNLGIPAYNMQCHWCPCYKPLNLCKINRVKKVWAIWIAKNGSKITHPLFSRKKHQKIRWRENISVPWWRWFSMLPHRGIEGWIIDSKKWKLSRLVDWLSMELVEMDKEKNQMCELFFYDGVVKMENST